MYSLRRLIKVSVLVLAVGAIASLASAAYCEQISQDQKDQLKDLAAQTRQRTMAVRQNLMRSRRELFEAYRNYDLNEKKAKAAIRKIDQSQLKLLHIHLDSQTGIREILDADQFAELKNKIGNGMRAHRPGTMTPMREDSFDKQVDKAIREEMNPNADQISQLNKLAKQKNDIVKKLRQNTKQMADMYAVYDLDVSVAKKLITSIHHQQVNLLNVNFKKQQVLRQIMTESQFNTLCNQLSGQRRKF